MDLHINVNHLHSHNSTWLKMDSHGFTFMYGVNKFITSIYTIGMSKTIYMHNIGVDKANNGPTNCTKTFGFNFLGNLYTHPKVIFH